MIKKISVIILSLFIIEGCASTSGQGYLNPQYNNYKLQDVVVVTDANGDIPNKSEALIVNTLKKYGVDAIGAADIIRFSKNAQEIETKMKKLNRYMIYLKFVSDSDYGSGPLMSQSFANIGNTPVQVTRFNHGAIPKGYLSYHVKIYAPNGDIIWVGEASKNASGLLCVDPDVMIPDAVRGLMNAFKKSGILPLKNISVDGVSPIC
ncbi:hypothetical protein ACPEEL_03470 [Pasteurella sp. PK-2025]|uniref:hypothetical protein n=1 Tax=unclassified Pasteurella TaxID=2621516 RepID=UPI003C720E2C